MLKELELCKKSIEEHKKYEIELASLKKEHANILEAFRKIIWNEVKDLAKDGKFTVPGGYCYITETEWNVDESFTLAEISKDIKSYLDFRISFNKEEIRRNKDKIRQIKKMQEEFKQILEEEK